jgi:acyl transferase domain-containing protein
VTTNSSNTIGVGTKLKFIQDSTASKEQLAKASSARLGEKLREAGDGQFCYVTAKEQQRPIVFAFAGQGELTTEQERELYAQYPIFQQAVDECLDILEQRYSRLAIQLSETEGFLASPVLPAVYLAQIEIFIMEFALANLLIRLNIKPDIVVGLSLGEYAAACTAGIINLTDALCLVTERVLLFQTCFPKGEMLVVHLAHEVVEKYLKDHSELDIAAINSASRCVVGGPVAAIDNFVNQLKRENIGCTPLSLPHAYHSRYAADVVREFGKLTPTISYVKSEIKFLSSVTGDFVNTPLTGEYWLEHLNKPVQFSKAIKALFNHLPFICLEIGPGKALTSLIKQHEPSIESVVLSTLNSHQAASKVENLLTVVGQLWLAGVAIDWKGLQPFQNYPSLNLPILGTAPKNKFDTPSRPTQYRLLNTLFSYNSNPTVTLPDLPFNHPIHLKKSHQSASADPGFNTELNGFTQLANWQLQQAGSIIYLKTLDPLASKPNLFNELKSHLISGFGLAEFQLIVHDHGLAIKAMSEEQANIWVKHLRGSELTIENHREKEKYACSM